MKFEKTKAAKFCRETDAFFAEHQIERKSLDLSKDRATGFYMLGASLYERAENTSLLDSYCEYFFELSRAKLYHFPENIFWDTDHLFFSAYTEIEQAVKPSEYLIEYMDVLMGLLKLFGKHSTIKFRYLHDFTYGFDWAKWVKKKQIDREQVGPFSLSFLKRMHKRGKELGDLILKNDRKYHQLKKSQKFRNPFLFLREPAEEQRLLQSLSKLDFIPVKCWDANDQPNWQKPFDAERNKISKELGILK